jgi:hypothetical protein
MESKPPKSSARRAEPFSHLRDRNERRARVARLLEAQRKRTAEIVEQFRRPDKLRRGR